MAAKMVCCSSNAATTRASPENCSESLQQTGKPRDLIKQSRNPLDETEAHNTIGPMASEYRRERNSDIWHFCSNCSQWPKDNFIEQRTTPRTEKMCNECVSKRRQDECK